MTTTLTDDIDGSTASSTIAFSYEGTNYEIDLSKANARAFEKTMALYVGHARKVRNTRRTSQRRANATDLGALREWARANGYDVSDRGRVSAAILEAYAAQ
jgi:hypothetical protein